MSKTDEKKDAKEKKGDSKTEEVTIKADNVILMKKGDYSIHVLIEEIKNCTQIDEDHLPYPLVKVTCFERDSKRTEKPAQPCTDYTFNEHFYFEKTNLAVEEIDSSKIVVEVYDGENSKKREDYFGIYEFDMEYVYSQPNHALKNFWLALANPESDDMTKVRGYLKLSISVLNDNDPRVELELDDNVDSNCVLPSQINVEYKQLTLNIFRAGGIPDMDAIISVKKVNRQCDGYVEVKYMGITRKTSAQKMTHDVLTWNEAIDIPIQVPAVSQRVVLVLKDYDETSADDIVGSIELDINDIINGKYEGFHFFDIYGSPLNKSGKYFDQMNLNAEFGSCWKGEILMKVEVKDVDCPSARMRKLEQNDPLILQAGNATKPNQWVAVIKLYSALYLPEQKGTYQVRFKIGEKDSLFGARKADKGIISWNHVQKIIFNSTSDKITDLPELFIGLENTKDPPEQLCFQRIKPCEFLMNKEVMVIKLLPDPCVGKVSKISKSGIIKVKIGFYNSKQIKNEGGSEQFCKTNFKEGDSLLEEEEEDMEKLVHIGKSKEVHYQTCTVVANVYMSRYIISKDSNGQNDPFVSIQCLDQIEQTSIKFNTVNGIWNEQLIFKEIKLDLNNKSTWPIMLVQINDYDKLSKDDLIAYSYIWLSETYFAINSTEQVRPKWKQMYLPKSNRPQGQLLISFYIFDEAHKADITKVKCEPETIPYSFEINILGLRDLKPLSLLPVKKAFIKFDMNSLNVTGKDEDSLQAIRTLPKDSGCNPTINTVVKFDIKLPKDEIFMPEMQCEVYDHLLSGMVNPLLGVFMLNVEALVKETHRQIEEDLKIIRKKVGLFLASGLIQKQAEGFQLPINNEIEIDTSKKNDGIEMKDQKGGKDEADAFHYTLEEIQQNKNNPNYFVLLPQFKKFTIPGIKKGDKAYQEFTIEDISQSPDDVDYFAVGYIGKIDKDPLDSNAITEKDMSKPINYSKHYRRIYRKGLEQVKELGLKSPFTKAYLTRGKDEDVKDEKAIFEAISNPKIKIMKKYALDQKGDLIDDKVRKTKEKKHKLKNNNYGKFKGVIRICEKNKMREYEKVVEDYKKNNPSLVQQLKNLNKYETLTRNILVKNSVVIRVYILELNDLAKKDKFSESDPYIKIYLGDECKVNEQKNYQDDVKNCKWYKYYDILSELPGDSTMKIEVWDYDSVFADELIGYTTIDLEDRYFNQEWKEMKYKPIEIRTLKHPDYATVQGSIYLWLEIFEKKDKIDMEPWMIAPEPETEVEMRLVVWETENMRSMDVEGTSDIFINAYIQPEKKQSTDVHYRCQNGVGSFNWRIIFPLSLPRDNKILTIQAYDNDLFKKNDFICGGTLDLRDLMKIPKDLDIPISFTKSYVDGCLDSQKVKYENVEFLPKSEDPEQKKFWMQLYKNNQREGRVLLSVEVLPKWKAEITKVGKGRSEPNVSPYLPPPVGRFEFSLNPFKMLNQCVGPKFRRTLYCSICMGCLVVYLICVIPYMILHLSGELVNPFNYVSAIFKK